jgi:hypothetical protein
VLESLVALFSPPAVLERRIQSCTSVLVLPLFFCLPLQVLLVLLVLLELLLLLMGL